MLRNPSQGHLSRVNIWVARLLLPAVLMVCLWVPAVAATYVTANGHVYLRKGPSTDTDIVLVLQPNDRLKVVGTKGDWYNVEFGRKSGYVRKDVVTAEGESGSSDAASDASGLSLPASGSAATADYPTLKRGDSGKEVFALQEGLIYAGHYDAMPDSKYGEATENAVKAFQEAKGLKADGIAGNETQRKLFGDSDTDASGDSEAANVAADGVYTALRYGDSGDDVTAMQAKLIELGFLSGSATGRFRSDTRRAVKLFQEKNGVTADGVAGKKTLGLLYGSNPIPKNPGQTNILVADEEGGSMKVGSTGESVRALQTRLIELSFLTGRADGTYGTKTEAAVRSFQQANGLTADGVAGAKTQTAIYAGSAAAIPTAGTSGVLKRDSQGDAVKQLQTQLKSLKFYTGSVTGNFGSLTEKAVMAFQRANGLTADGIAGKSTLAKVYGGSAVSGNESSATASSGSSGSTGSVPAASLVQNVNWYSGIRNKYKAGTTVSIYDFSTGLSWKCRFQSMGKHADSEPVTSSDTEIMYRAFGNKNTWNPKAVWVTMPDGKVFIASLHNMPHLSGPIKDNNFDGHLCIHFPRTMSDAEATGPYAVSHQKAILAGWEKTQRMAGR